MMRHLSPRKVPSVSDHKGSGRAVVRFVEPGARARGGPIRDVYLGLCGSDEVEARYEEEVRRWIEESLRVGWAPAGWRPAETGHEGVLTVADLVDGYGRRLESNWGRDWRRVELDPLRVREYQEALEEARRLRREGRASEGRKPRKWVGDRLRVRESRRLAGEARVRHGRLDADLDKERTARVLDDLVVEFGPTAAAVLGDRELRRLREKWAEEGLPLADRRLAARVVKDAYRYVVGRDPWAPWDVPRSRLEREVDRFGLDLGAVGKDGRWARSG